MAIDKLDSVPDPQTERVLAHIQEQAVGVTYSKTVPTIKEVPYGKVVIHDDGAGTKRIYFRTGEDNLGFVNLT
jgi:hypothetical protein